MEQVVIQPQVVGLCCFHQRVDDCTGLRALGRIGKEPSLPTNDKGTDGVFNLVVADFNLAVLKKRTEVRLRVLRIGHRVLQLAYRTGNRIQPFPVRLSCASLHSFSSSLDSLDSSFSSMLVCIPEIFKSIG